MAHPMLGLGKWLARAEWREPLALVVAEHVGAACDDHGVAIDDLEEIIGQPAFIDAWAAACEDFMTRDLEDGRNITADYLKRRGWKESPANREYLQALRRSAVSLYEVVAVTPGQHFTLRDRLRPGEPFRVDEPDHSRHLDPGQLISARVFKVRQRTRTSEAMLAYTAETAAEIEATIADWIAEAKAQAPEIAAGLDLPADAPAIQDLVTPTLVLEGASALFTDLWLRQVLAEIAAPPPRRIVNRDGDPYDRASATYPLRPGVAEQDLDRVLLPLAAIERASDRVTGPPATASPYTGWTTRWHWVDLDTDPGPEIEPEDEPGILRLDPRTDSGRPILGDLALKDQTLCLIASTPARLERGRALLEPVLAGLVGEPEIEIRPLIDVLAELFAQRSGADADAAGPRTD